MVASAPVLHFGTFDVDNYGDLLFPKIVAWRLRGRSVVAVSPTDRQSCFVDSVRPVTIDQAGRPGAVVVGGGNIVHLRRTPIAEYRETARLAYPLLNLGAADLAMRAGAPLIINSPSISVLKLTRHEKMLLRRVLSQSDYVALRDDESVRLANEILGGSKAVKSVPDTAFDISKMWPNTSTTEDRYIVVHVNERYGGSPESTSASIRDIVRNTKRKVVLLPIGPCHGDDAYAQTIASGIGSGARIEREYGLERFAALIAGADMYIGSSMHGFITAVAYQKAAYLVLGSEVKEKFRGAVSCAGLSEDVILPSWQVAATRDLYKMPRVSAAQVAHIQQRLDRHWDEVEQALLGKPNSVGGRTMPWRYEALLAQYGATLSGRLRGLLGQK